MLPGLGDEANEPVKVVPLRMLLGALTMLVLAGAAGFLLWGLVAGATAGAAALFVLVLVLGGAGAALFAMSDLSVNGLRVVERVVFGALTFYLGWSAYQSLGDLAAAGDLAALGWRWNLTLVQFVLLMVGYGTAVPNAWPRAARVIVGFALVPVAVVAMLMRSDASAVLGQIATGARVAEATLALLIGAVLAIVAAYIIDQYLGLAGTTRISIRYLLKCRIGMGGMGEVWLGEHNLLARPAAIKLIRADAIDRSNPEKSQQVLRRFEREAKATANLRSPHTVEVYDFGVTEDGTFYYAMEHLDGVDMSTLVEQHGALPPERVVYLLAQACQSLADAHAQGLTHRDIKPANLFVCRLGTAHDFVKVLDFGLVTSGDLPALQAEAATDLTIKGEIHGTPGYMAPEQVHGGGAPDSRADIYALGCVGYYMLAGLPVFDGPPLSVLVDHVKSAPTPPSQKVDVEIPQALEQVILRCLEKDPSDRYQSAVELAEALSACCPEPVWDQRRAADWWRLHLPEVAA